MPAGASTGDPRSHGDVAVPMHTVRRVGDVVCHRTTRAALLLVLPVFLALPSVGAAARPIGPMTVARLLHTAQLRLEQATIVGGANRWLQHAPNDCALAVVGQLQRIAGRSVPDQEWLARSLALTPDGVVLDRLAATLRQLGWPARVIRGAADVGTQQLQPPAVALMRPGHYVLLIGRTTTKVEYFDPLVGLVHQPLPPFEARWTGKSVQLSTRDN